MGDSWLVVSTYMMRHLFLIIFESLPFFFAFMLAHSSGVMFSYLVHRYPLCFPFLVNSGSRLPLPHQEHSGTPMNFLYFIFSWHVALCGSGLHLSVQSGQSYRIHSTLWNIFPFISSLLHAMLHVPLKTLSSFKSPLTKGTVSSTITWRLYSLTISNGI